MTGVEIALSIASTATPVITGVIGYIVRQSMGRMNDRMERMERDSAADRATIEAVRRAAIDAASSAHAGLDELRDDTVRREDYIREAARNRQVQERLVEGLARVEGKLDIGVRVAQGIERLGDQMRDKGQGE